MVWFEGRTRRRARRAGLATLAGLVAASVCVVLPTLTRASADAPTAWSGSGPTGVVVSDGTAAAPQFSYNLNAAGFTPRSWSFTTTATSDGTVTLPYHYTGLHAYFEVTVQLATIVVHNGVTTTTQLVNDGPIDCCTAPSAGFTYTGTTTLSVQSGDTYGFTFGGSNQDINNFLHGTLTLPLAAYTDAAAVAQNTSWANAAPLTTGRRSTAS